MARERIDVKSTGGDSEFWGLRRASKGNRQHGLRLYLDKLFTSAGTSTPQSRGFTIEGDRTEVMGGDAHDMGVIVEMTNYAVNTPTGSYQRGVSVQVQNRGSGALGAMEGALISTRQRGDGALVVNTQALRAELTHDAGGTAATGFQEVIRATIKINAHAAAHADATGANAIVALNAATGTYNNKPNAFAARSLGQPFLYIFDLYDSRVKTSSKIMRFPVNDASSLPAVWFAGTATDDAGIRSDIGADSLWADGSLYSSISDSAGKLFIKTSDVWTSAI